MNQFQVIQPSVLLSRYIKQYWFVTMSNVKGEQRMVPFGHMALSIYRNSCAFLVNNSRYIPRVAINGVMTQHVDINYSGYINFISIIFQPAGANAFFTNAVSEFSNSCISLDVIADKELKTLELQLNNEKDTWQCVTLIEQFLLHRLYQLKKTDDKRLELTLQLIDEGEADINNLAQKVCLSYKQFKRIFTEKIGVNPKKYLQIQRFQKLHHLLQQHTTMNLWQLACECGYYDKSHLIKESKEFSGFTPAELSKACDLVYSDYHALFRSAFVDKLN